MKFACILAAGALSLSACASTAPRLSIENDLQGLGFSQSSARCLSKEAKQRLERDDLEKLARIIDAAEDDRDFFSNVRESGNIRIVGAMTAAAAVCALDPDAD